MSWSKVHWLQTHWNSTCLPEQDWSSFSHCFYFFRWPSRRGSLHTQLRNSVTSHPWRSVLLSMYLLYLIISTESLSICNCIRTALEAPDYSSPPGRLPSCEKAWSRPGTQLQVLGTAWICRLPRSIEETHLSNLSLFSSLFFQSCNTLLLHLRSKLARHSVSAGWGRERRRC